MKLPTFEPYRIFFLTGVLLGLWGAGVWILFYLHQGPYPVVAHPALMMGGFLLSFVCGFLMTAAPKFTGSFPMTSCEMAWSIFLNLFLIASSLLFNAKIFYLGSAVTFVTLIAYFLRRFVRRTQNPPAPFVFIGLGLGMGLLGSLGMLTEEFFQLPDQVFHFVRSLYLQGYILSLIVGVGSRLVPALLGHSALPNQAQTTAPSLKLRPFFILMSVFALSYLIEAFVDLNSGLLFRSAVVLFVMLSYWKIHVLPVKRTRLAWGLIISAWLMLIGLWGSLWSMYRIHFLHVFFIGGLGLMTFMIAVRVILSHGNHGLVLESKSKVIPTVIGLVFAAALTRLSAGFIPAVYLSHLAYAATVWCVAVALWAMVFVPRILRGGP